jgi:hypothetical protein
MSRNVTQYHAYWEGSMVHRTTTAAESGGVSLRQARHPLEQHDRHNKGPGAVQSRQRFSCVP